MPGLPVHHQLLVVIRCVCVLVTQSCPTPWDPMDCSLQVPLSMGLSRQEYWSGLPFPSPEDLPDPGIKPGLTHCRQILYHLSHQIRYLHFIWNSMVLFAVELRLKMYMVMVMKKFAGKKKNCNWSFKRGDNMESCESQSRKGRKREKKKAISKCYCQT